MCAFASNPPPRRPAARRSHALPAACRLRAERVSPPSQQDLEDMGCLEALLEGTLRYEMQDITDELQALAQAPWGH